MDSAALGKLSRTQIQSIARREKVKANGRSEDIIRLLIQKHPKGVPRKSAPGSSPAGRASRVTDIENNAMQTEPSTKDVRRVMRDLAKMVNARPEMQNEIEETRILLKTTRSTMKEVEKDLKEVVSTRVGLEEALMKELKKDQKLWDGVSSFPLDDDITDRILTWLPDFGSLQASIIASKSIHAVFGTHPKSIIRAVAYNVVGPALPQALRLVRRQLLPISSVPSKPELDPDEILNGDMDMSSPLEPKEVRKLVANARVVGALENMFSYRHKDRKSQSSLLSSVESLRFQSAMYRFWLFSDTFPVRDVTGSEEEEDIDKARRERKALLDMFSSEELRQLQMIAEFLEETYSAVPGTLRDVPLAFGPDIILQCFEQQTEDPLIAIAEDIGVVGEDLPILDDYVSFPLSQIWTERKIDGPPAKAYKPIILDTVPGENDRCCRCDIVHGLELWDESNWATLKRNIASGQIMSFLKGNLGANPLESVGLLNTLSSPDFSFADLMQEIHDIKIAAYDNWEKKDALCRVCVVGVIRCHLHIWYLEQKRKGGQQIFEDCWYGYNCRTQVHKYPHAQRLNHLCEPTRGE